MTKQLLYVLLVAAVCFSCNRAEKKSSIASHNTIQESDARQYLVKVGDPAPDFEMSLPDGKKVRLSDLRGKVVMLQFTASWCGVCRKEMPHIERDIWQNHKDNPQFALFGIDREEPAEKIQVLRDATGVTYPIGMDPDGGIFGLYAEKDAGITRNVIIDREGKIVMLTRLFEEEEFGQMVSLIDRMVNGGSEE
ncbi:MULTISPECIES: TlpA family protein disulfide reductase [Petrimonas]|jgi:peroxiredoxin|uniref:Thiol-disulfide oxidoreductase ResA n=1 Tax=Petrimonas mucosa TaxID=1642646 RepID=A0A1G4G7L4_9BACT|nr:MULTISPECIES: TlpA disulfide reductase family protein [Petrimonas]MDD3560092.1 TlpA disulfide reductase family protein [Petrimonas mucosa]SCM58187.1 Thiol-disulfide oxidoreductase ResA {ECO:0000255/HAMAP-Rule:MF_01319} [Petrimonas mucosa]SFU55490.1 Peroxiredoxin [Porphyromonadaceae bacterium KHP3R9]HHT30767.1 TlpA family protein disulfide reductase [Petrimonas mucosa]